MNYELEKQKKSCLPLELVILVNVIQLAGIRVLLLLLFFLFKALSYTSDCYNSLKLENVK